MLRESRIGGRLTTGMPCELLDRRVGREQLGVGGDDREVHVRAAHGAHQVEHLARRLGARGHRRPSRPRACRSAAAGRRGARAPRGRARSRRSRSPAGRTRDAPRACAGRRGPPRPAPTISARRGAQHVRQHPGAHARAPERDQHQRERRGTSPPRAASRSHQSSIFLTPCPATSRHERAGQQRVEEVGDLVEAARRDRARLALVEPVGGEHRRPQQPSSATASATSTPRRAR